MSERPEPHPVRDFFVADLVDYAPKDSADMMERPFFSISKRKRVKPIEYKSPDGSLWIKVEGNPLFGMATIWDADILIWCLSMLARSARGGANDISNVIHTSPHELLVGIARGTGGRDYRLLMEAIKRLQTTMVETNIRGGRRKYAAFHYLAEIEGQGDRDPLEPLTTISLRVPDWLMQAVRTGHILTLDREYFLLTGGIERALYRVARKHAGSQREGWTCRISVLHTKTGSEAPLKKFAFRVRDIVARNELPRYAMSLVPVGNGEPGVRFIQRTAEEEEQAREMMAMRHDTVRISARAAWIDSGKDPRDFDEAFRFWIDTDHAPDAFASAIARS